jgi:hypothetical protein
MLWLFWLSQKIMSAKSTQGSGTTLNLRLPAGSIGAAERAFLERAMTELAPLVLGALRERKRDQARRLARSFAPEVGIRHADLKLLEMQKSALESILQGSEWLTAEEIGRLAGRSPSNPAALASRWKREGKLFAVHWKGKDWFPRYAFDAAMQPRRAVAEVLKRFGPHVDAWRVAAWFESTNGWLDNRRPREAMDREQDVILAAERKAGVRHG